MMDHAYGCDAVKVYHFVMALSFICKSAVQSMVKTPMETFCRLITQLYEMHKFILVNLLYLHFL